MAITQICLLKILCHNRAALSTLLDAIRQRKTQPGSMPTILLPITAMPSLQDHIAVNNIEDLKYIYPGSFDKIGGMPTRYSISLDLMSD